VGGASGCCGGAHWGGGVAELVAAVLELRSGSNRFGTSGAFDVGARRRGLRAVASTFSAGVGKWSSSAAAGFACSAIEISAGRSRF